FIVTKDNQAIMIDLEKCGEGRLLEDMTRILLWGCNSIEREGANAHMVVDYDKADAFLRGYRSVHPLSHEEQAQLFQMVKDRALTSVAFSQIHPFPHKPAMRPQDYRLWNEAIDCWADRMANSATGRDRTRRQEHTHEAPPVVGR